MYGAAPTIVSFNSLSDDVPYRVCMVMFQTVSAKTNPSRLFILNLLPARWQHRLANLFYEETTFRAFVDRNLQRLPTLPQLNSGLGRAARGWWTGVLYAGPA